jgi:uncharacterized protein
MMPAPAQAVLFPPPEAALSLYRGDVMHARLKPLVHRFSYRVFSILIDLTRLEEAARASALFSVNRRNLVSFYEQDHGASDRVRDGSPLLDDVARVLVPTGIGIAGGRVLLLCYPRIAGFVFNPLSVYFIYDAAGRLRALIYEVRNTFGERHSYVAPVAQGELSVAGVRQERAKLFYVSPFNSLDMGYRFRILPPGERIAVRILEMDQEGPLLAATFVGERSNLTTASLLAACAQVPLLTGKVLAGIHFEALRLWGKGLRLQPRPAAPAPLSYGKESHLAPRGPLRSKP